MGCGSERTELFFYDDHTEGVALIDFFDDVEAFRHFAKTRVVAVQVCGVLAVVDDEELGPAGVSACMGHAEHTFVVILVLAIKFAVDGVAWTSTANSLGASPLGNEPRNDPMKLQSLVKAFLGQLDKVRNRIGGVLLKKLHGHCAVVRVNFCIHGAKMGCGCRFGK